MPNENKDAGRTSFPERFAEEIARRGWTQKEAAERAAIPNSTLSNWLAGPSEPRGSDLIALADLFQCSIDWLVGRTAYRERLPASHWVVDKDRVAMVRDRRLPPDGGRFAWPIPDHHEVLSSAQLERLEAELFGKPTRARKTAKKEGDRET